MINRIRVALALPFNIFGVLFLAVAALLSGEILLGEDEMPPH